MRVCQPRPVARKAASTSGLYRTATCSFVGRRFGPRVLARPTSTPFCFCVAPSQSETFVMGYRHHGVYRCPAWLAHRPVCELVDVIFPVDAFFMFFSLRIEITWSSSPRGVCTTNTTTPRHSPAFANVTRHRHPAHLRGLS